MIVLTQQPDGSSKEDAALTAAFQALPQNAYPELHGKFADYKNKFKRLQTQKCDGCLCAGFGAMKGVPINVPDETMGTAELTDQAGAKVQVTVVATGVTARIRYGVCVPRGQQVFETDPSGKRREIDAIDRPPHIEGE